MLENAVQLAQSAYNSEVNRVGAEAVTMNGDFYKVLGADPLRNPRFDEFLPSRPTSAASMNRRSSGWRPMGG